MAAVSLMNPGTPGIKNTTHCDCWETSNNLEQYFPNTASSTQTSNTHTNLQPASHNASIAHCCVMMKNIHVLRFKLKGFTVQQ